MKESFIPSNACEMCIRDSLTDSIHVGVASGVDSVLKGLKYILADFTEVISSGLGEFQIPFYQILGTFCQVFCVVAYTLDVADTVE